MTNLRDIAYAAFAYTDTIPYGTSGTSPLSHADNVRVPFLIYTHLIFHTRVSFSIPILTLSVGLRRAQRR